MNPTFDVHAESENQRTMEKFDMNEITVVRDLGGNVLKLLGLRDGEWHLLYFPNPKTTRPADVHVSRSRRGQEGR